MDRKWSPETWRTWWKKAQKWKDLEERSRKQLEGEGKTPKRNNDDRYASGHDVTMVLEAVLDAPSGAAALREVEERSHYPGLSSFTVKDAAVFFGREREVGNGHIRDGTALGLSLNRARCVLTIRGAGRVRRRHGAHDRCKREDSCDSYHVPLSSGVEVRFRLD